MLEKDNLFSKIFMWMFVGLAVTFTTGYIVSINENMLYNVFSSYYIFLIILELLVVIVLSASIRKLNPMVAKILFIFYSFLTGLTFSSIFVLYNVSSIIYIFGITSILFLILSLIGYFTNIDLTKFSIYLFMILLGIVILSIINMFILNETLDLGLSIICLIVFIIYVAYDIQVIKNNLYNINEDNLAIYGALQLYLDFINIFLKLLRFFGNRKD